MTPLKRYIQLLNLDKKDIIQIFIYAALSGLISLTLPLGIQAIINFIQSGKISTSWIVLVILVIVGVALNGLLNIMQLRITENLQQKIFIRSAFEFAGRIPKIKFDQVYNNYLPDFANRFFDTMSIQKGTSKLLIDFSAALLQITFGLLLLSLYHPFFIFFGIILFILLYLIFKYSFQVGLDTSIKESKFKYRVVGWLQELARNYFSFKKVDQHTYALEKNDNFVSKYLGYRENHFQILKKQYIQLIIFKIIITAGLLIIGGFLVINQQMNIGQFVAAEIVILLVISSVEKIIVGLETLYDVLTSVDKIASVIELEAESFGELNDDSCYTSVNLHLEKIEYNFPDKKEFCIKVEELNIDQGERILITGDNGSGKSTLLKILAGIIMIEKGNLTINDNTFKKLELNSYRNYIGSVFANETPFEGTILENITYNNNSISDKQIKWALDAVKLTDAVKKMPNGLDTKILPDGAHVSSSMGQKILLARAIINNPKILFLENPTDKIESSVATEIIDFLTDKSNNWTIVVISKNNRWINNITREISLENGIIIHDTKKI